MNKLGLPIAVLLILLAVVLFMGQPAYTIFETEQVIITRFGRIVGKAKTKPGLHFKLPFVDQAVVFDKRWLE